MRFVTALTGAAVASRASAAGAGGGSGEGSHPVVQRPQGAAREAALMCEPGDSADVGRCCVERDNVRSHLTVHTRSPYHEADAIKQDDTPSYANTTTTLFSTTVQTVIAQQIITVYKEAQNGDYLGVALAKRNTETSVNVVTQQSTVTAAPAGTTTVFMLSSSLPPAGTGTILSTVSALPSVQMIPEEMIMSSFVGGSTAYSTKIVEPLIFGTSTAGLEGGWVSSTILLPGQQQNGSMTTLTDPINPSITTIRGMNSTTYANDTSIDTQSYLNISTFSMTDCSTTQAPAWSSTWLSVGSGSTLVEPSRTSQLVSTTARLGSSSPAKAIDHDGISVVVTTLAAIAACFVLALFL